MSSERSPYDTARFGFTIHRACCETPEAVDAAVATARADGAELLILRFPTHCQRVATHVSRRRGCIFGDVLVHYARTLDGQLEVRPNPGYTARLADPTDGCRVEMLATWCFRQYATHYRANPRTDDVEGLARGYGEWAARLCTQEGSVCILIEAENGTLAGFAACQREGDGGRVVLFGVDPEHRRRGLCRRLIEESLNAFAARGGSSLEISTHVHNTAVQRVCTRAGFELRRSQYTVHLDLREGA